MSDTIAEIPLQEEKVKEPVRINKRILEVADNLKGMYRTAEETVGRDADIAVRQNVLKNMQVNPTWYSKEELVGSHKPWTETFLESDKSWSPASVESAKQKIDLAKPIEDPDNLHQLSRADTVENSAKRKRSIELRMQREKDATEKQKREEDEARTEAIKKSNLEHQQRRTRENMEEMVARKAAEEAQAELDRIKEEEKLEQFRQSGKEMGKSLAEMVYAPQGRKETDRKLNGMIALIKGPLTTEKNAKAELINIIDSRRSGLTLENFPKGGKIINGEAKVRKIKSSEIQAMADLKNELNDFTNKVYYIRAYERRGWIPEGWRKPFDTFNRKVKMEFEEGFNQGYAEVKDTGGLSQDKPWYIPDHQE